MTLQGVGALTVSTKSMHKLGNWLQGDLCKLLLGPLVLHLKGLHSPSPHKEKVPMCSMVFHPFHPTPKVIKFIELFRFRSIFELTPKWSSQAAAFGSPRAVHLKGLNSFPKRRFQNNFQSVLNINWLQHELCKILGFPCGAFKEIPSLQSKRKKCQGSDQMIEIQICIWIDSKVNFARCVDPLVVNFSRLHSRF